MAEYDILLIVTCGLHAAQLQAQNSDAPALLLEALRMGLHALVDWILPHIENWLASENALPALVYGLTRLHMAYAARTALGVLSLEAMQPLLAACFERACLRLTWLGQMDTNHATACADALADLNSLARAEVDWIDLALFQRCVEALYDSPAATVLRGRAAAILAVRQIWTAEQTLEALTEALNQAQFHPNLLSEFLSGFLPLARSYLLQSPDLLESLGEVIIAWDEETFLHALPAMRLAFTVLKPRETQALAELLSKQLGGVDLMPDGLIAWSPDELRQLKGLQTQARQCAPHDRFLDVLIQKSIRRAANQKMPWYVLRPPQLRTKPCSVRGSLK